MLIAAKIYIYEVAFRCHAANLVILRAELVIIDINSDYHLQTISKIGFLQG